MTTSNLTERIASDHALHNAHMVQADFNMARLRYLGGDTCLHICLRTLPCRCNAHA